MNQWISVNDSLPKPFEVVWIYWRDREVLLGIRICEGDESIRCDPSEGWYSFADEKCRWTHWWQRVNAYNFDKPDKPDKSEEKFNDIL